MKVITDKNRIEEIFNRGIVSSVLPSKEGLFKRLFSGDKLKIYIGADPTSPSLHLSHAKNYMFLEELRQLGHEVIILVGDFTAQIGDPTDTSSARVQLTESEVKKNVQGWVEQIRPLLNFDDKENPPRIVYNNNWLSKLTLKDVVSLASNFTVQQMMERDMFEKRLKGEIPIYLHEFLYPLMQGYDSVALDVDVELCGTDQTFNALAGRTLLKRLKNKEKFIITVNLMENPKTGKLMSKSSGTGVFLSSLPNDMYGAVMSQPDEMIEVMIINCTRFSLSEKEKIMALGPRDAKARVAFEIVKKFYGDERAKKAEESFVSLFQKNKIPDDIKEIKAKRGEALGDVLLENEIVSSKSEYRRLVQGGAVDVGEVRIDDIHYKLEESAVVKIGKKRFVKIKI